MNDAMTKPRVLVVDDQADNRQLVAGMLVRRGFRATMASNGFEAMQILATETVDAVVSDTDMPEMLGVELLRNVRMRYPKLPVLLMSPFLNPDLRESLTAWGATEVLSKPVDGVILAVALWNALGREPQPHLAMA